MKILERAYRFIAILFILGLVWGGFLWLTLDDFSRVIAYKALGLLVKEEKS